MRSLCLLVLVLALSFWATTALPDSVESTTPKANRMMLRLRRASDMLNKDGPMNRRASDDGDAMDQDAKPQKRHTDGLDKESEGKGGDMQKRDSSEPKMKHKRDTMSGGERNRRDDNMTPSGKDRMDGGADKEKPGRSKRDPTMMDSGNMDQGKPMQKRDDQAETDGGDGQTKVVKSNEHNNPLNKRDVDILDKKDMRMERDTTSEGDNTNMSKEEMHTMDSIGAMAGKPIQKRETMTGKGGMNQMGGGRSSMGSQ